MSEKGIRVTADVFFFLIKEQLCKMPNMVCNIWQACLEQCGSYEMYHWFHGT